MPGARSVPAKCSAVMGVLFSALPWSVGRAAIISACKLAARYRAGLNLTELILWLHEPIQDHLPDRS